MAYKVIILYQLYMPSYFLGTFTEYPFLFYRPKDLLGVSPNSNTNSPPEMISSWEIHNRSSGLPFSQIFWI